MHRRDRDKVWTLKGAKSHSKCSSILFSLLSERNLNPEIRPKPKKSHLCTACFRACLHPMGTQYKRWRFHDIRCMINFWAIPNIKYLISHKESHQSETQVTKSQVNIWLTTLDTPQSTGARQSDDSFNNPLCLINFMDGTVYVDWLCTKDHFDFFFLSKTCFRQTAGH